MSRIETVFADKNHKALIAYTMIGYPTIESTLRVTSNLAENGCDVIELGIPFSDPLADGPTIQQASHEALQQGVTMETCLEVACKLRQEVNIPLVFLGYYNPVFSYGPESFCAECGKIGIDGLIIPDLPPEESKELEDLTRKHDIDLIYLLSPNSTDGRIELVAERAHGFIYLVSLTGVTGTRDALSSELESFVHRVRQKSHKPLCVGFGISNLEQAKQVATFADGIIVGSRILQLIREDDSLKGLTHFVRSLRDALQTGG